MSSGSMAFVSASSSRTTWRRRRENRRKICSPWGGGSPVPRDRGAGSDLLPAHGETELTLDLRLDEQREEAEEEEGLDPPLVLQERRRDLVDGLQRLEAALDHRLPLVGLEDVRRGEGVFDDRPRLGMRAAGGGRQLWGCGRSAQRNSTCPLISSDPRSWWISNRPWMIRPTPVP